MKKMLFGLIATVMMSVSGNAQKITQESFRLELSKSMVSLVNDLKPSYKNGMSYKDFTAAILAGNINSTIPVTGDNLLKKAHYYLANNASDEKITASYEGTEMADVYFILKESKNSKIGAIKIFGNDVVERTEFGQNMTDSEGSCCRWLVNTWNWIWSNKKEIIEIICLFTTLC